MHNRAVAAISTRLGQCLIRVIGAYQFLISPLMGPCCRFQPTCSEYSKEALSHCGILRGLGLSLRRILRCQPCCKGGYDPVPYSNNVESNNIEQESVETGLATGQKRTNF